MASTSAARRPRARLVGPAALAAFAVLIGAGLVVLFLRSDLVDRVMRSPGGDALTDAYLSGLQAIDRGDPKAALLLARSRLAQGRISEAQALLAPYLGHDDAAVRREAGLAQLEVLRITGPAQSLAAAVREQLAAARLPEELAALAAHAEAAGDVALLREVYGKIAPRERDPRRLESIARSFLAKGEHRYAAELLFLARQHAVEPVQARELYLAAVRALQAGNLPREALAAAQAQLGSLADDEGVLLELVHVARAAARPDVAAQLMKRVIWLRRKPAGRPRPMDVLAAFFVTAAWAAEPPAAMRRFDPKVYGLAYEVFLADGDLDSAYRVAREAVAQRPQDAQWRRRLAQVCEQSGRPAEALSAWRWLAERGDDEEAWQALLRLAPGLNDDEALTAALRRQAQRPGATRADLRALAQAYERLGRPEEGVRWFEERYRSGGSLAALEIAAGLAEELGRSEKALALYQELLRRAAPTPERVVRVATLHIMSGRFGDAHALLARYRDRAGPQAREYWELLAELAWNLQAEGSALDALGRLVEHRHADARDFERLVMLLRARQPQEAARIAHTGFAQLRDPRLLLVALELLEASGEQVALKRIFASLGPAEERLFSQNAYFYRLRSQHRRRSGDPVGARADLERALQIAPEDLQQRVALLWLLIESREHASLRRALLAEAPRAAREELLWRPLASGWMTLEEPGRALPFIVRVVKEAPRDFLWLAMYADALEQDGQLDAAHRVRRHAWAAARSKPQGADPLAERERLEQFARLALRQAPGDAALGALRDLLRRDSAPRTAPDEAARRAAVDEIVLAWLVSSEQHEQARQWLWQRYARRASAPAWVEVALAAAENDAGAAAALLERRGGELSRAQAAQAARLAGRTELAAAAAFDAQAARPSDDSLHRELAELQLDNADRLGAGVAFERYGVLETEPVELDALLALTPSLRLVLQGRRASQVSRDAAELANVPAHDTAWRAGLRLRRHEGWLELGVGGREGFADSSSARLRHYASWTRRLSTLVTAARNERTVDSPALAVAGMRDELSLLASYQFSRREFASGLVWAGTYRSQNAIVLGRARGYELELGHRVRIDYPDLTLRVFAAGLDTRTVGTGDPATAVLAPAGAALPEFFVPDDSRRYGLGASFGESVREGWTRGWRPYAGLDLTHNSVSGGGYQARVGLHGNLVGADRLWLYWARGSSVGASNDTVHEFGIRYEYRFSRS